MSDTKPHTIYQIGEVMNIKCFWIEPTNTQKLFLRRYISGSLCSVHSYHDMRNYIGTIPEVRDEAGYIKVPDVPSIDHTDSRWPVVCDCGYEFKEAGEWQLFNESIYKRIDTGEEFTLRDAPVGAIWNAFWMGDWQNGPDGRSLVAKLPGRYDWMIDGSASNCTKPEDKVHRCWVRHGEPPNLTVDKNGNTCNAGGGSIVVPGWHGFLINGELTQC